MAHDDADIEGVAEPSFNIPHPPYGTMVVSAKFIVVPSLLNSLSTPSELLAKRVIAKECRVQEKSKYSWGTSFLAVRRLASSIPNPSRSNSRLTCCNTPLTTRWRRRVPKESCYHFGIPPASNIHSDPMNQV